MGGRTLAVVRAGEARHIMGFESLAPEPFPVANAKTADPLIPEPRGSKNSEPPELSEASKNGTLRGENEDASSAPGDGSPDAPSARGPHSNQEIISMMDAARAQARAREKESRREKASFWDIASVTLLWTGVFIAIVSIILVVASAQNAGVIGLVLAGGLAFLAALFLIGAALRLFSPILLTGALLRRAAGKKPGEAAELAGAEILEALGLAERVLDADGDARLVTRRDGVVTYANRTYIALARAAGVAGPAGLPPRIDRLFAQQGAEATKVFRLCRAAQSGAPAQETIYQLMGLEGGGKRRRFAVTVSPIRGADEYVSWLLRELPVEEEEHDVLAAAYADFPEPVFALEKSGQIAWANAAMRARLNAGRGALRHIDDVVLGETRELVRALWRLDLSSNQAAVRRHGCEPGGGDFTAFRRGGVGEGFVCVALTLAQEEGEEERALSNDIRDAPFGAALIEGEFGKDAKIVEANKIFAGVFAGAKKKAALSKLMPAEALEELAGEMRRKPTPSQTLSPVEATLSKDGGPRTYALYARPVRRRRGSYGARRTLLYSIDATEKKRMETENAQDQKLKGIGQLASKVAHDFNNYLQAVLGNCERLMLKHPAGDPAYQELVQIRENAQRAANVTKQLLAFSRKQTLKREVQSITELLRDFSRFLDRNIGEKVSLELVNGRGLPPVKVDRFQLETAIMNLAVNARDAMAPKGGKLTISTKVIEAHDIGGLGLPTLAEEDHVLIEVSDTGPGVPHEIAGEIFDPFFTTKDIGKGTGLGLSTVYGVIGQMGGAIALESGAGAGATFKIYLPAHSGDIPAHEGEARPPPEPADLTGVGRILVVEDEGSVRKFVVATLNDCGYEVTQAEDGDEALEIIEAAGARFDLVITDIMMPVMNGPTMIEKARRDFGLKARVIFMSGYAEAGMRDEIDMAPDAEFIQKPISLRGLAAKVKHVLEPAEPVR